jgi:hypothetical protein
MVKRAELKKLMKGKEFYFLPLYRRVERKGITGRGQEFACQGPKTIG